MPDFSDWKWDKKNLFSPAEVVIPLNSPATSLNPRDGSNQVEESKSDPSVRPEVNERIDAGVAQSYEQEYCVDVAENMTEILIIRLNLLRDGTQ